MTRGIQLYHEPLFRTQQHCRGLVEWVWEPIEYILVYTDPIDSEPYSTFPAGTVGN
jgi:hypothetical protein